MNQRATTSIDAHIGKRVRIRRVLFGLSQSGFAEKLGLTFQQVQKYEIGANRISAARLWDIAKVLDVPVEWFFAGLDGDDDTPADAKRETLEMVRSYERCGAAERKALRTSAALMAGQAG